jgi:phosphatidylglycerophosphate synthase
MSGTSAQPAAAAWIVTPSSEAGEPFTLWGMSPVERLRRSLARAGCREIHELGPGDAVDADGGKPIVLMRSDWIYDERLVTALIQAPDTGLVSGEPGPELVAAHTTPPRADAVCHALRSGGPPPAGLELRGPTRLAPSYTAKLRKFDPPFLLRARPDQAGEIERRTFSSSYKGATDLVTKWLWPVPARIATRILARAGVHPNTITILSWILAVAAFWLFWRGDFGVGLVTAWLMTFLDTVDGKLARVTLTSSELGNVLDHGLDLVHPPFWWYAWGVGLGAPHEPATLVVVAGYFLGRIQEGIFLSLFGFECHSWRPIDTLFRTITARRNPNLIFLSVGTAVGRPDLGMAGVALWTLASLLFHTVQLAQAGLARSRGEAPAPWDEARRAR